VSAFSCSAEVIFSLPGLCAHPSIIGAAGFSVVDPNTHIRPHYGETNLRIRFQLALITPEKEVG
jgi:aspartyl/asparaginyl beta-hydroxylase (cupin superfamily)